MAKKEYSLQEVVSVIEMLWPLSGAEPWDNSGLQIGHLDDPVTKILLSVDAVSDTVVEAIEGEYSLLLSHHPLLFKSVTSLAESTYHGSIVAPMIRARCALYSAHTSADVVTTGTSREIAKRLGLKNQQVLVANGQQTTKSEETGLGIVGQLPKALTLAELANTLADILPITVSGLRVAGNQDERISSVALCAGAGDSLLDLPAVGEADVYITSDLRHHPALETKQRMLYGEGPALIDISHWAAESLWLKTAQQELAEHLPGITIDVSYTSTDPWDFLVIQSES